MIFLLLRQTLSIYKFSVQLLFSLNLQIQENKNNTSLAQCYDVQISTPSVSKNCNGNHSVCFFGRWKVYVFLPLPKTT